MSGRRVNRAYGKLDVRPSCEEVLADFDWLVARGVSADEAARRLDVTLSALAKMRSRLEVRS